MLAPPFPAAAVAAACAAAKRHLRIAGTQDDDDVRDKAMAALGLAEAFTGQALIRRAFEAVLPAGRAWERLPAGPVAAITGVVGVPAEGAAFALASTAYAIDIDALGDGWVRVTGPGAAGRVRVTFAAGLAADWEALPEPLKQGVAVLTAHLFEARVEGDAPPAAVAALWRPWRRMRLDQRRPA